MYVPKKLHSWCWSLSHIYFLSKAETVTFRLPNLSSDLMLEIYDIHFAPDPDLKPKVFSSKYWSKNWRLRSSLHLFLELFGKLLLDT